MEKKIKQLHSLIRQRTILASREKTQLSTNERNYSKKGQHRLHYTRVRKRFNSWVTRTKLLRLEPSRKEISCCADTCCTNPFTQEGTVPLPAFQKAAFQPREVTLRPFRIIWCLQSTQRTTRVGWEWHLPEQLRAVNSHLFTRLYWFIKDVIRGLGGGFFSKDTSGSGSACLRNIL